MLPLLLINWKMNSLSNLVEFEFAEFAEFPFAYFASDCVISFSKCCSCGRLGNCSTAYCGSWWRQTADRVSWSRAAMSQCHSMSFHVFRETKSMVQTGTKVTDHSKSSEIEAFQQTRDNNNDRRYIDNIINYDNRYWCHWCPNVGTLRPCGPGWAQCKKMNEWLDPALPRILDSETLNRLQ